jgi:hypothetical protein
MEDNIIMQIREAINEKTYTIRDISETDLTSANLHFWMKEKLLLNSQDGKKGWTRFNFIDYVWLKIILYMNDMGISSKGDKVDLIINILKTIPVSNSIADEEGQSEGTVEDQNRLKAYKGLESIIIDSISTKCHPHIQIYREGNCKIVQSNIVIDGFEMSGSQYSETYIQIGLADIFTDFIMTMLVNGHAESSMRLGIINNDEGTLLDQLANKIVTELNIKDKGKKSVNHLIGDEVNKELYRSVTSRMVKGSYQKMTYKLVRGTIITFLAKQLDNSQ